MTTEIRFADVPGKDVESFKTTPICINCGAHATGKRLLRAEKKKDLEQTKLVGYVTVPMCEKCSQAYTRADRFQWATAIVALLAGFLVAGGLLGNRLEEGFGSVLLCGVVFLGVAAAVTAVFSWILRQVAPGVWDAGNSVGLKFDGDTLVMTVRDDDWIDHIDTTGLTVKKL